MAILERFSQNAHHICPMKPSLRISVSLAFSLLALHAPIAVAATFDWVSDYDHDFGLVASFTLVDTAYESAKATPGTFVTIDAFTGSLFTGDPSRVTFTLAEAEWPPSQVALDCAGAVTSFSNGKWGAGAGLVFKLLPGADERLLWRTSSVGLLIPEGRDEGNFYVHLGEGSWTLRQSSPVPEPDSSLASWLILVAALGLGSRRLWTQQSGTLAHAPSKS